MPEQQNLRRTEAKAYFGKLLFELWRPDTLVPVVFGCPAYENTVAGSTLQVASLQACSATFALQRLR